MKKIKISDIATKSSFEIGDTLIGINSQGLFRVSSTVVASIKRLPLAVGSQFALLSIRGGVNGSIALASGLISFNKVSWDLAEIGLFSIHVESTGIKTSTTNSNFKFYSVIKGGVEHVAIKKPNNNISNQCSYMPLDYRAESYFFEIVNESELTDITAL